MTALDFTPHDQLPIISTSSKKGEMSILRIAKKELEEAGYPAEETKGVFDQFFEGVKNRLFKVIPDNAHLLVMPSTTGKNTLPLLLARELQQEKPGIVIHNADFKQIEPVHQLEGKNKLAYLARLDDPIRFKFEPTLIEALKAANQTGKPIYASDDIVSQGGQFRALSVQLKAVGIPVAGIVALRASSVDYPKEGALRQTFNKIEPYVPPDQKGEFHQDFMAYFGPFPRAKLYRFDQMLNALTDWQKSQELIRAGARQLRELSEGKKPDRDMAKEAMKPSKEQKSKGFRL